MERSAKRRVTVRFANVHASDAILSLLDWAVANFGYELAEKEPTAQDVDRIIADRTVRKVSQSDRKWLLQRARSAWRLRSRRNPWGWSTFGLQETMERAEHPRSRPAPVPEGKRVEYRGYRILPGAGGWMIPELEPESRFDSVKDAKRFIQAQEKWKRNHAA